MAKSLTSRARIELSGLFKDTQDLGDADFALNLLTSYALANGSGADQANMLFSDERTLAASANEELDLAGGLNDAFGAAINFTKVKLIAVIADRANANNVVVGGAASNGFSTPFGDPTDTVKVLPGGSLLIVAPNAAGYAVTAGTGDRLKIANSGAGTPVKYKIVIFGTV